MNQGKKCNSCNTFKSPDSFYKNKARHDGLCNYCKICDRKDRRTENRKKQYRKEYFEKNKEKMQEYYQKYYLDHKDIYDKRNEKWRTENRDRLKELQRNHTKKDLWRKRHKFQQAKRRAQKLNATMSNFDEVIKEIYKNCPDGHHVDHIVPLLNPIVCGLHVPWNLQYLPAEENFKKNNRFGDE